MIQICEDCQSEGATSSIEFGPFILIDLQTRDGVKENRIWDLPGVIDIQNSTFRLFACVEYIGEQVDPDSIGHYSAHILRKNNLWENYDDLKSASSTTNIIKHRLVFIVLYKKVNMES